MLAGVESGDFLRSCYAPERDRSTGWGEGRSRAKKTSAVKTAGRRRMGTSGGKLIAAVGIAALLHICAINLPRWDRGREIIFFRDRTGLNSRKQLLHDVYLIQAKDDFYNASFFNCLTTADHFLVTNFITAL